MDDVNKSLNCEKVSDSKLSTDLLQDLVNVDLVRFNGLDLLLAGAGGSFLYDFLGCWSLCCGGLDSLLSDLGSHYVCALVL